MKQEQIIKNSSFSEWKKTITKVAQIKSTFPLLQHTLYVITGKSNISKKKFTYDIKLIEDCEIYCVHFPSAPTTPSSCIIDIAKELLEDNFNKSLMLKKVCNINFITPHTVKNYPTMRFTFDKNENDKKDTTFNLEITDNDKIVFSTMEISVI